MAPVRHSIASTTPARSALARADATAPSSRSTARIGGGSPASARRRSASASTLAQVPGSKHGHDWRAMGRPDPAATPADTRAASITMVPDPHIGSTNGVAGSHRAAASIPAATDSRRGARAVAWRQPRS